MTILKRPIYSELAAKIYYRISANKVYATLAVGGVYLLITLVVCWPISLHFDSQVAEIGDPFFVAWVIGSEIWTLKNGDFGNFWNQNIFFPYSNTLAFSDHSLTLTFQVLPVGLFTANPVILINTLQLQSFLLSALFAYFLVTYYTGSRKAGFVGGAVYAFSSFHVGLLTHIQIISYQYIPLAVLLFERLLKKPTWKTAFVFAAVFMLNAYVSIYLLGFILVPLGVILLLRAASREIKITRSLLLNGSLTALLALLFVLPGVWLYPQINQNFNVERNLRNYYDFSAHFDEFLIAPKSNWLMGGYSTAVQQADHTVVWNELTLYLGFLTIGIALAGAVSISFKRNLKKGQNRVKLTSTGTVWLAVALISVILAIGPVFSYSVSQSGTSLTYGPYYLLFQFVPVFRGIRFPSRFIVIVALALAVLIGLAVRKAAGLRPGRRGLAYAAIVFILVVEQGSFPLQLVTPSPVNAALYEWTRAHLPAEAVVLHYPFQVDNLNIEYERGSLIDHRRMLNGYSSFTPESIQRLGDLSQSDAASSLRVTATLGVGYLIIHSNMLVAADPFPGFLAAQAAPLATVGDATIFDLNSYKDTSLFETVTVSGARLENGKLVVTQTNTSSKEWVALAVESFDIEVNFLKEGKPAGQTRTKLFRPLFLSPGETFSSHLDIATPLFGYDSVTTLVK